MKKLAGALLIKLIITVLIVAIVAGPMIMGIQGVLDFFEKIYDSGIYTSDIFYNEKEQQQVNTAHQMHYQRTSDTGFFQIFSKSGDYKQNIFDTIINMVPESVKEVFDWNDEFIRDANGNKIIGLKQAGAFDVDQLGNAEKFYRAYLGRESNYTFLDPQTLLILNTDLFNNATIMGDIDVVFPEHFTKPINFVNDYMRTKIVNGKYEDFVYTIRRDEEGKVINKDEKVNCYIYDFVIEETNNIDYWKKVNNIHYNLPISFEFGSNKVNKYENEYKPLKRRYFEVDENGEPIVPKGEEPPKKYLQLVDLTNEAGELMVTSVLKYNYDSTKEKKVIWNDYDTDEVNTRYNEFLKTINVANASPQGLANKKVEIEKEVIEEKKLGSEGDDWEWDYKGKYKLLAETDDEGNLIYQAKEEDFRYYYFNEEIYDRVYYTYKNGNMVFNENPNSKYENKNRDYAWDPILQKAVYKHGEVIPLELKSIKDKGLAPIFTYVQGKSMKFMQAISADEIYDTKKAKNYIVNNYDKAFSEADNGFFPTYIDENDTEFYKEAKNDEQFEYIDSLLEEANAKYDISKLLTDEAIDNSGKFKGIEGFDNKELNNNIHIKSPHVEGTFDFLSDKSIKDQILNPEKYYLYWSDYINKDNRALEFWLPAVASISGSIQSGVFKDSGVNGEIDFKKFEHNENLIEKKEEITGRGEVQYSNTSMTQDIFLLEQALTLAGRFFHTYKEETRIDKPLSDIEKKAVVGLYETGRHWVANKWDIEVIIEETRYKRSKVEPKKADTENTDNTPEEPKEPKEPKEPEYKWETYTVDKKVNLGSQHIGLEFYKSDIANNQYTKKDMGKTIFKDGFKPNQYKNAQKYNLIVPTIPNEEIDNYNFEEGEKETFNYVKSEVKDIYFNLDLTDNRNKGELKELYRVYYGQINEVRPFESEIYYEEELIQEWSQRLQVRNDEPVGVSIRKKDEGEKRTRYLYDYLRNFEADIPNQVIKDYKKFEATQDYYYDAVQSIDSNKKFSKDVDDYRTSFIQAVSTDDWKKAYSNMGLDFNFEKDRNTLAMVLMGLVEEERNLKDENRKGYANIYFPAGATEVHANQYYDKATDKDNYILTLEKANNPIFSINYVAKSLKNAILNYDESNLIAKKASVLKGIQAYHMGKEAFDQVLESNPDTWMHRTQSEILNLTKMYSRSEAQDVNQRIVEDALSYLNTSEAIQTIANTNTDWYSEIWNTVSQTAGNVIDSADKLMDKMFGSIYTTKENKGIVYYKNHLSDLEAKLAVRKIFSVKKRERLERVEWSLFDYFGTRQSNNSFFGIKSVDKDILEQLIYNIDEWVVPIQLQQVKVSSSYGLRQLKNGERGFHRGIDIGIGEGTPIHAVADGEVYFAGWNGGYGNVVYLKHYVEENNTKDYVLTIYAHMVDQPPVIEGQQVKAGDVIGFVGDTGHSFGDHLHFEINCRVTLYNRNYDIWNSIKSNDYKQSINPFWIAVPNPTEDQIARFSVTKTHY